MNLSLSFIQAALKKKGVDTVILRESPQRFERAVLLSYADPRAMQREFLYVCTPAELADSPHGLPQALCIASGGVKAPSFEDRFPCRDLLIFEGGDKIMLYCLIEEIFALYDRWERSANGLILNGGSLQDMIDSVGMVTKNPCYVMDNSLHIEATTRDADLEDMSAIWRFQYHHGYWPIPQTLSMINTTDLTSIKKNPHARIFLPSMFNMPCCAVALSQEHEFFGYLFFIEVYYHLDATDLEVIERLNELIIAMYRIRGEEPMQKSGSIYEKTFIKAAHGEYRDDPVKLRQELSLIGWQDDRRFRCLALGVKNNEYNDSLYVLNSVFSNELKGKVFYLDDCFNCVFSYRETPDFEKSVRYYLSRFSIHCGVSEIFSDLKDLEFYHSQAVFALQHAQTAAGEAKSRKFWHSYEDIFPFHIGMTLKESLQKEKLWSEHLETLRRYDETHHTDYVNTLFWYLQEERNVAHTARKLHLHRNSLLYRLEKINEILGLDLDSPSVRMRTLLEIYVMTSEKQG